ncbi:MAG: SecD/SecF fusion protein [Flavobacteriales bacterium]|jgi:SecD/SecF fusion protein
MENRSAIWIFTVLLVLACLYQLSFNFFSSRFEDQAAAFAIEASDADSLSTMTAEERTRKFLIDSAGSQAYPVLGHSYREVKDQELNLGLDLQGGMSVTLEVSVPELVENLSAKSKFPAFTATMAQAREAQTSSNDDFITLFANAWADNKVAGEEKLPKIFINRDYTEKFQTAKTDDDVIEILRVEAESAIDNTENILRQRIDRFGVSQPNIQRQSSTGRILVELAGVDNPDRIIKLIKETAELEFWPVFENTEIVGGKAAFQYLEQLDSVVAKYKDPSAYTAELFTTDSIPALDLSTNEPLKDADGNDSISVTRTIDSDIYTRRYPIASYSGNYGSNGQGIPRSSVLFRVTSEGKDRISEVLDAKDNGGRLFSSSIIPENILLRWDAKPSVSDNGTEFYSLYALNDVSRREKSELNGGTITNAIQTFDQYGGVEVSMQMNSEGAQAWGKMTQAAYDGDPSRPNKAIAITLDGLVYSAPSVNSPILNGSSSISMGTGSYSQQVEEGTDLANLLEAGSLPAPAKIVNTEIVGPTLGAENISAGAWSFIIALLVIMAYMLFYYSRAGVVSDIALVLNIFLLIGGLAAIGATLTLPGIAGLVLTLGMAVDANVLIFERIREEMRMGKGLKVALTEGYQKAYSAIFDANITTLLTAIVLFVFGSGAIKGFATTLIIGIFTSLFSAIVITRLIFWNRMDKKKDIAFSTPTTQNWFTNLNYRFVDNRKKFYILSGVVVTLGLVALFSGGLNYGVEFNGGRENTFKFETAINTDEIRKELSTAFKPNSITVKDLGTSKDKIRITTDYLLEDKDTGSEKTRALITSTLEGMNLTNFTNPETRDVDSSISDDFRRDARNATIIALLIIFFYIFLRFRKWQYGLGALLAMLHDVIIVLSIYSIGSLFLPFTLEVDQAFIAAILTVIGYSINDTVVVFDRIREYLGIYKKEDEKEVINKALNSTLSRTINTSASTFVVLLSIFILGSDSIRGFTFALMVGVVVGTYSSIFIATPSVIDFSKSVKN